MIPLKWIFLLCHLLGLTLGYYEAQPKIKSENGHLIFESGLHRNITFIIAGQGRLRINDMDVLNLLVQTANRITPGISSQDVARINVRLGSIEGKVNGRNGVMYRLRILENNSLNASSPGNGGNRVQQINRRLQVLEMRVETIFTKLNEDNCRSVPCQNGGTCVDGYDTFQCQCPTNWQGRTCSEDVNECANFAGTDLGCQNGAVCINSPGSYTCQCRDNFQGMHCAQKIKDCSSASSFELCGHGICISSFDQSGYRCLCDAGWKLNTPSMGVPMCMTDINECDSEKPHCSVDPPVVCRNLEGSYTCGPCPIGYSGSGHYCVDINECEVNNGGCSISPAVSCHNTRGSHYCDKCPLGYVGDGRLCIRTSNTCDNANLCHPLARCVEYGSGIINCICRDGFTGSGFGNNGCSAITGGNGCSGNPCLNGGTCTSTGPTAYTCTCPTDTIAPNCQRAPSPCDSNPCQNSGICRPTRTRVQYACNCTRGFTGRNCDRAQPLCGGIKNAESGNIQYPPAGSGNYQTNEKCAWLLKTSINKVLNVTFTQFHLEESSECRYDWLQIHDGRTTAARYIGRFCGTQLPLGGNFISTHNLLYLWFRSDNSSSHPGFNLSWDSIDPQCGEVLETNSHGTISSPGSPGNYPINRNCFWYIKAPAGKRLQLHFYTMKIELHANCSYDFVRVFQGSLPEIGDEDPSSMDHNVPIIAEFCNTTIPAPVTTPTNEITIYFHSDGESSDSGFQMHYTVTEGIPGCGGVYTNKKGEFGTPIEDGNYPNGITCEYLVQLPLNSKILLRFLEVDIEAHSDCRFDFVKIYDGDSDQSPIIHSICGRTIPLEITSSTNMLFLRFKSDWSKQHKGFRAAYETVCGGRFDAESGIISSPFYPQLYEAEQTCHFYIETPLGTAIKFQFTDFDLETGMNECSYDIVAIYDGIKSNQTEIGRYCGSNLPPMVQSTTNYLHLEFRSDVSISGRGFKANYSTIDTKCGGIMKTNNGIIRPPENPNGEGYTHATHCQWVIVAPIGEAIQLQFSSFDLEASSNCNYDYLQVFDNSSDSGAEIAKYCGRRIPPAITSSKNILTLIFVTDLSRNAAGFSATYNFVDTRTMCGGNFFSPSGYIRSPGWPNEYDAGKTCQWVIQAPKGQQITLNVLQFDLEMHELCRFDWLEIRNGGSETSPLIGKFCGTQFPNNTIRSFGNKLYLRFVSDVSRHGKGFNIEYDSTSTGCGGRLTTYQGFVTSPHYPDHYDVDTICSWQIIVNAGSIIEMVFSDLEMESLSNCHYDYIEIYDGRDVSGRKLGRFCHPDSHPLQIVTNSNLAFLRMKSDGSENGRGFNIKYRAVCTRTITDMYGVIESPNFPHPYPVNLNCEWKIQGPKSSTISIDFSHFDLERSSWNTDECNYDFVTIVRYNDEQQEFPQKYCDNLPNNLTSFGNVIAIKFRTDSSGSGQGFRLEYKIEGCGGMLTKPSGNIMSPNYPNHYPKNMLCQWHIEAEPDNSIELTIHNLLIEGTNQCNYDYLLISPNPMNSTHYLRKICDTLNSTQVITGPRTMYLTFESDSSITGMGFNASYKFVQHKCGGLFQLTKGFLLSPGYPSNYPSDINCEYLIEVPENHLVELNLMDINVEGENSPLEGDDKCPHDRVLIFDGVNRTNNLLLTLCGRQLPNITQYISTTNHLLVVFETDHSGELSGFKFNFTMSCGTTIIVNGSGKIETPFGLDIQTENCTWHLKAADESEHITFNIGHLTGFEVGSFDAFNETFNCTIAVEIYDGDTMETPIKKQYCGSYNDLRSITSTGQYLTINLHVSEFNFFSRPKFNFVGFYSTFDTACGGEFNMLNGKIASPEYPLSYPRDVECTWKIVSAPGNAMSLVVSDMNILSSDNNCNEDYLEVRNKDEGGELLGVFCGDNPVSNLTSNYGFWMKFRSGTIGVARGFLAQFFYNEHSEIRGSEGEIGSPLYPEMYHGDPAEYTWRITVSFQSIISLAFTDYMIDAQSNYCFVKLAIYDGYNKNAPELASELCGTEIPETLKSSSNVIFIHLEQSRGLFGTKFLLKWKKLGQENIAPNTTADYDPKCGNKTILLSDPIQLINFTSPGWPDGYETGLTCNYVINSNLSNYHTKFSLDEVDLEDSEGCVSDYVQIWSSNDLLTWTSLGKKCGTNYDKRVVYEGKPYLKLDFISNYYANRTGISGVLNLECGNNLRGPSGVITYDSNIFLGTRLLYNSNVCLWNITVRAGHTIRYSFNKLNFTTSSQPNCGSALVFKNGIDDSSPILGLGKYCGTTIPDIPMTTSNRGFVKLSTKFNDIIDFELKYEEVGVDCNDNLQLSHFFNQTIINTPNYPNIPQPHSKCTWTISVPSGEYIKLEFMDFHLIQSDGCRTEYVEIRMGATKSSPVVNRFCGDTRPQLIVKNNIASVTYYTSNDTPHNGFKMKALIAQCGAIYEGNNGIITSPNYKNGGYAANMQCEYHVITSPGTYINFTFTDIDLPVHSNEASNCTGKDNIEIFTAEPNDDIDSNTTYNLQSLGVFCEDQIPPPIITESNEAFIKFTSTGKRDSTDSSWKIKYMASTETCGGRLNMESGEITSPGYPNKSLNKRFCDWYITVPKGRRIKIEIEDLDFIQMSTPAQRLIFYNDHTLGTRIVLVTGGSTQRTIYSSDNKLRISYWKRTPSKNRGFKLSYSSYEESICVGDLNGMDGIIQPPNNQTTFVCEYLRTAQSFYRDAPNVGTLALEFTELKFNALNFQFCVPTVSKLVVATPNGNEIASICKNNSITVRTPLPNVKVVSKKSVFHSLLEFKLSYKVHKCGGILSSESDEIIIKSQQFTQNYGKLDCAWQVNFGEGEKVMANVIKIAFKKPCDKEFMIIYQGNSNSGPPIIRFCESGPAVLPIISQTNQLFLEYHTDEYSSESEFEIRFNSSTTACGGLLKHNARILSTPVIESNSTRRYPHNAECIWEIESRIGYHIGLVFTNRFNLEQSDNCTNDYVEAFDYIDDSWKSLGKVCGRTMPTPFNSTSTRMRVLFRSNSDVNGDGFTAKWLENCGGTFKASDNKQYLTSPGYPDRYLPFTVCNYTVTANANQHINFEFEDFQLEESSKSCLYDNVTLYQYREYAFPPELEKKKTYCGRRSPGAVRINEKMVIEFITDNSIERAGFRVSYQTDSCGGLITEPSQIRTPKHQGDVKYPNSLNCYWNITANDTTNQLKRISITFDMMQLEHSQQCYFDYLEIFKGLEISDDKRIAKLCGNDTGHTINIDSDKGIVHFRSDTSNNFNGFIATISFTEYCDRKIELSDTEEIINIGEYRSYMNCHYSITAPMGSIIKLTFNNLHIAPCPGIQNSTKPCTCDYLEVRDGLTPFSDVLGRYCGHTIPEPIISSISSMYIIFVTDGQSNSAGFTLKVKKEVSICGQAYYNLTSKDQTIEIQSPGTDTYPANIVCRWFFETNPSRTIEIEFLKFDLQEMGDFDCSNDVLEITDSSQKNYVGEGLGTALIYSGRNNNSRFVSFHSGIRSPIYHTQYCGSGIPMNYFSYDHKVDIKFQTDSNIERSGFKLRVRQSHSCERNYTSTQGRIKHEGMDTCTFWIIAPENYTISLYFIQIYFMESDCAKNGIKIYENGPGGKLLLEQCGYNTPSPLFLTTNKVYIETKAPNTVEEYLTNILVYDMYYLAQTISQGPGCGGDIYNYGGMFASPGYPDNDRNNSDCRWNIIVPVHKVALRFSEFNMGTPSTCSTNYVEIIEKDSQGDDTVARTYCGGDTPAIYRGLSKTLSVRLHKTANFAGTGFLVQFLAAAENADVNDW